MPAASEFPIEVCPNHPEVASGLIPCARCGRGYCADCVVELDGKPYDAVCKEEQLRDLRSGTSSAINLASAWRRFAGMFVDGLIFLPVYVIGGFMTGAFSRPPQNRGFFGLDMLVYAGIWILYEAIMLNGYRGQTIGKKAVGLRVVNVDGSALRPDQAWKRSISRQLMGITYILGFIDSLMVFSAMRRTLHDRFASTVVVKANP